MVWPVLTGNLLNGWVWYGSDDVRHQGWKIHVAAVPAQNVVTAINQACGAMNDVAWKYLASEKEFNGQSGEQRGKWNCVYPTSTLESMALAMDIRDRLRAVQAAELGAQQRPPYDKYVCQFICVRYGPYVSDKLIRTDDKLVTDIWKKNGDHPPWVNDPWGQFNALCTPGSRAAVDLGSQYPRYRLR